MHCKLIETHIERPYRCQRQPLLQRHSSLCIALDRPCGDFSPRPVADACCPGDPMPVCLCIPMWWSAVECLLPRTQFRISNRPRPQRDRSAVILCSVHLWICGIFHQLIELNWNWKGRRGYWCSHWTSIACSWDSSPFSLVITSHK